MIPDCPCGFTFYLRGHLYAVIAELEGPPQQVVVVSLTTKRAGSDETVVLTTGDHPFLKHDTSVNYQDSRIFICSDLIDRVNRRFFTPGEAFPHDIIKVMQQGLMVSPHTPNGVKSLCAFLLDD